MTCSTGEGGKNSCDSIATDKIVEPNISPNVNTSLFILQLPIVFMVFILELEAS